MNYVIIGNGTAAVGAVEGIRVIDRQSPITLVSVEPYPVYGRPLISYLLYGQTAENNMLHYRPVSFYEDNNVTLLRGKTVAGIDDAAKTVTLQSGETIPYDRLCICTGCRPVVPPMDGLDTVAHKTSFITLDDAKQLDRMLGTDRDKRVLIVGAGLIGLKYAEGVYRRAKEVTVVDLAPRILPNVLTEEPAAIIQRHIESKGVRFLLADSVERFFPHGARLQSGRTVDFDVLVIAVGVRPNTELAAGAGCAVNRDILINDHAETSLSGVYAAGDCTVSHGISADTDRILAILPNAYLQGETAGIYTSLIREQVPLSSIDFALIRDKAQLMAFSRAERAKQLGGVYV